jgi:hypothetical protein
VLKNVGTGDMSEYVSLDINDTELVALNKFVRGMYRPLAVSNREGSIYFCETGGEIIEYSISGKTFSATGAYGIPLVIDGALAVVSSVGMLMLDPTNKNDVVEYSNKLIPNAVSATSIDVDIDGENDVLISDKSGKIHFLKRVKDDYYFVENESWGGTFSGFASRLAICATDIDNDGDVDCFCGTENGKVFVLRNPKIGKPKDIVAISGIDNVLLTWKIGYQSCTSGYKVYRSEAGANSYSEISSNCNLPIYRDFPPGACAYDYKVSSISRFYTAGNSTPTVIESPTTEAVRAELGTVKFFWNDVVCKLGENANVMLSIENSMNYDVASKSLTVRYDPECLRPLKIAKTGLTEDCEIEETEGTGEWEIVIKCGKLPAGGGKFLIFVFETLKEGTTTVGCDSNSLGTANSTINSATVSIAAADPENPTDVPPYSLGDVNGDGKLDQEDVRELARLKNGNGRKYTSNQLKAGDFNGNGKLDNADYQALRALLKEKGVL